MAVDLAAPQVVPGELLVQYVANANPGQKAQARASANATVAETIHTRAMQSQGFGALERVKLGPGVGITQAIEALQRNPHVQFAEPNYVYQTAAISNDTYYGNGNLWGMYGDDAPTAVGPAGTSNTYGSHAEKAWNDGVTGSASVVVGIIDQGIQVTHPDVDENIWVNPYETAGDGIDNDGNGYVDDINGWNFVYNKASVYDAGEDAHGTHVAGTIGGEGGNGTGVVGVNWDVSMISLKFLGPNGGTTANAVKAVDYLTDLKNRHNINIVASNNSWGGGGYSQSLHDAIIRSAKKDILFVAAAGNSTANNDATASYPSNYNSNIGTSTQTAASYDNVIAVASITSGGGISSFSSYGATTVDIGAPGSAIMSSVPTNTYASYNGTSMATPHVAGAAALYASAQPVRVSAASIKDALLSSATPTASLAGKTATGGRLNVHEALKRSAFVDLDRDIYGLTGNVAITVNDVARNASGTVADTVTVAVSSTTESAAETVVLTETGPNTGRFTGSIALTSGAATQDGLLTVAQGDQIRVYYAPLNQTAVATVDGVAPVISAITSQPSAATSSIRWTTNETSTTEVRFGTDAANLNRTYSNSTPVTNHVATLGSLTPSTTYYYQVQSRDFAGNLSTSGVQSFTTVAPSQILLVDDDQGATFERFYRSALQANSLGFDQWDAAAIGASPTAADLSTYDVVVWNTGFDYTASTAGLSSGEQTALAGYLDQGGRLFLSGQDILFNGVTASFRQNYLKVAAFTDDVVSANHTEIGVAGNTIGDGMTLALARPSDFPSIYADAVSPVAGAEGTFLHGVTTAAYPHSSVNYRGDYATGGFGLVFTTFPFEAVSATGATPNNQAEMMRRTVNYLLGISDVAGVNVSAPSSAMTSEGGASSSFTVALAKAPTSDVTIPIASSLPSEAVASVSSLVFTPANWAIPQTVSVTGVNDDVDDGDVSYSVVLGAATSSDPSYAGFDATDVSLTNADDDTVGFLVTPPLSSSTTEAGGAAAFSVRLTSQPMSDVTVAIASSDSTEGTASVASLVFTAADWNLPQTVSVTGLDDLVDDGNVAYSIVLSPATSTDPAYQGLDATDVGLSNTDNDTAAIVVGTPTGTTTSEAGGTVSFTLVLATEPTADVTIPVSSSDATEGAVNTPSVVFTPADWNVPQTVTVTGLDDLVSDGNVAYSVVLGAAASADSVYAGRNPADVSVINTDDEPAPETKFYVVNDGAPDQSYEYDATGAPVENYTINVANTAPRGIATTAAADKVWVVDRNKTVYVYNNSGSLLGSWVAGSMANNATVEGIATDGTNVWLVDARADRVFYYAGAASRLSGSATATSFVLGSGNTNPKDLVFGSDASGSYLWVVNDAAKDRVFRYAVTTATGGITLQNSWLLNTANKLPTGITLDPANGSQDLWVVDSGTDRVYRYASARTLASPALTDSFGLSVGNTNPQGIADPPPAAVAGKGLQATQQGAPGADDVQQRLTDIVMAQSFGGRLKQGSSSWKATADKRRDKAGESQERVERNLAARVDGLESRRIEGLAERLRERLADRQHGSHDVAHEVLDHVFSELGKTHRTV
jgi:subtilisin family serine protease